MVAPPVPTLLYFYWYLHAFLTNLEKCYTHIYNVSIYMIHFAQSSRRVHIFWEAKWPAHRLHKALSYLTILIFNHKESIYGGGGWHIWF